MYDTQLQIDSNICTDHWLLIKSSKHEVHSVHHSKSYVNDDSNWLKLSQMSCVNTFGLDDLNRHTPACNEKQAVMNNCLLGH